MKRFALSLLCVALILSASAAVLWLNGSAASRRDDRLSQEEINALRERYPIYGSWDDVPQLVFMAPFDKDHAKEIALKILAGMDTVLYVEATGETTEIISRSYPDDDPVTKEKWGALYEELTTFRHTAHSVIVIEDTAGLYQEGDVISVIATGYANTRPELTKGDRFILGAFDADIDGEIWYGYGEPWVYHVTDEGRALNANWSIEQMPELDFSGLTAERVMQKLAEVKREAEGK